MQPIQGVRQRIREELSAPSQKFVTELWTRRPIHATMSRMPGAGRPIADLVLSEPERAALQGLVATGRPSLAGRAEIILRCAQGLANYEVAEAVGVTPGTVGKWRRRFVKMGLAGLDDGLRNGRPRIVDRVRFAETFGADSGDQPVRPPTRAIATSLGVSQSTASRLRHADLPPRRVVAASGRPAGAPASPASAPQLLSERVYDVVRSWISSGELQSGTRVVESEIARVLGTSPTPAREAIRRLAQEGLVTHRPRLGNFVTEISQVEAREAREVRVLIESAAARRATGRLTAGEVARLRGHVGRMGDAARGRDIAAFREADLRFHREVCSLSGNSVLLRVWGSLEPVLWNLQVVSSAMYAGDWVVMAERHTDLIDALLGGDPAESVRLFSAHARGEGSATRPATRPASRPGQGPGTRRTSAVDVV